MRHAIRGAAIAIAAAPGFLRAEGNAAAQASNPVANMTALHLQNQYTGELTRSDRDANQAYPRYARPFKAVSGNWLMRATLPINTFPKADGGDTSGLGDFNVFAAWRFDTGHPGLGFDFGPQITAPTASNDTLGSGQWSLGFANVLFDGRSKRFQWGYLLTWQASVGGDADRADVNVGALQPFGFCQLGQGCYLPSSGIWTYNFEIADYAMPIGLGHGTVTKGERPVMNLFVAPRYSVATQGDGQSQWGDFANLNFKL